MTPTKPGWRDDHPWWHDAGPVELLSSDDSIATGILKVGDFGFDGEDEYPIWTLEMSDGSVGDFYAFSKWRRKS